MAKIKQIAKDKTKWNEIFKNKENGKIQEKQKQKASN